MEAFLWDLKTGRSALRRVRRPIPSAGEVLVRIAYSALCGTDTHIVLGVLREKAYARKIVLGHAWSGTIVELGVGVHGFRFGDMVFGSDYFPCGRCLPCRQGRHNLCGTRIVLGMERPGTHAEYAVVPARYTYRIPRGASLATAPFVCDIVATADAAIRRARPRASSSVVIYGAGPLGLALGMLLRRIYRVKSIFLVEPSAYRRRLARRLFRPEALPRRKGTFKDQCAIVYETSGTGLAVQDGLHRLVRGGTLVLVGVHDKERTLPLTKIVSRQLSLVGSFTYPLGDIPRALRLARRIHIERLVTHRFPLRNIRAAYRLFMGRKTGAVLIRP